MLDKVKVSLLEDSGYTPVKEADLSGHLENSEVDEDESTAAVPKSLAADDYPVFQAITLLKGLSLWSSEGN